MGRRLLSVVACIQLLLFRESRNGSSRRSPVIAKGKRKKDEDNEEKD